MDRGCCCKIIGLEADERRSKFDNTIMYTWAREAIIVVLKLEERGAFASQVHEETKLQRAAPRPKERSH